MDKFPKLKYPNDPSTDGIGNGDVVVTEKLDGANFRFTWDEDHNLRVGTRNHTYDANDENLPHAFRHAVEYVQDTFVGHDVPAAHAPNYTLYGEAMHQHHLDYDDIDWHQPDKGSPHVPLDNDQPNVVIFDARRNGDWLNWPAVTTLAGALGFTTARELDRGPLDDADTDIPDQSMFGGEPEGIVVRRLDGTVRAKKVREDFRETNSGGGRMAVTEAESSAADFVNTFITEARVRSVAHSLVDKGQYERLEMPMMEDLPREVLVDAMAENGWNLLTSGGFEAEWDDDFKSEVRSKASRKCSRVLKRELQSF